MMAAVAWPVTVPTTVLAGSLTEQARPNLREFQPEIGPARRRRATSISLSELGFEVMMTPTEWQAYLDWWRGSLADGALDLSRPHPRTGATVRCQMLEPPAAADTLAADGTVRVTVRLLVLPS